MQRYIKATREHKTEAKEKPYLSIKQYNICECMAYIRQRVQYICGRDPSSLTTAAMSFCLYGLRIFDI